MITVTGEPRRRQALGHARAADESGAAMSLATATEYALMLTPPHPAAHRP